MRPVFCGSFDYETRQTDLDRLFSKYGRVQRVDMKNGFAFVYFDDEKDGDDAIKHLDNTTFGYTKRRITVEWARGERGSRNHEGTKSMTNQRPTKTLFVINFDPNNTRSADIEKHFEPYGKVSNVRIRRNFAFVQFDTQEDATKALEATHLSEISGRVVSVEYALKDDSERRGDRRGSPRRGYGSRGGSPYGRSRSPVHRRSRPSPDYGRGPSPDPYYARPRSPAYVRPRSPAYGRPRSPAYDRPRSPAYGRPRSPAYGRPRSPAYGRPRSPDPVYGRARSPGYDRYNAPAYNRKSSPGYDRYRSGSPLRR